MARLCFLSSFTVLITSLLMSPAQDRPAGPSNRELSQDKTSAARLVDRVRKPIPIKGPDDLIEAMKVLQKANESLQGASTQLEILTGHSDPAVRREAILTLAELTGTSRNTAPVVRRLIRTAEEDEDIETRAAAFLGLSRMAPHSKSAMPLVLKGLGDHDARIRRAAYMVISKTYSFDKGLLPHVIKALDDPDLGPWKDKPGTNSVSDFAIRDLQRHTSNEGKEAVLKLINIVQAKKGDDRYENSALHALARVAPEERFTLDWARQWLKSPDIHSVQKGAGLIVALGPHGSAAVPDLIEVLRMKRLPDKKQEEQVKRVAVEALESIGADALPDLRKHLSTMNIDFLLWVEEAIKRIERQR